jgi:hypothetical protein
MGMSGRIGVIVVAVVFGVTFFWVRGGIGSITGPSLQTASDLNVPIFEPDGEGPTANGPENDVPAPILVPSPVQTPSSEIAEIAADPQTSEAGEIALREPPAEGAKKPDEATEKNGFLRGNFDNTASLPAETVLPQTKSPSSGSTSSFGSPPSENTPALYQEPALPTVDTYIDETLLPAQPQTAPPDTTPTSTEETFAQPPPEPVTDAGTPTLPPEPPAETTTSSPDLPADVSPHAEGTTNLEQ